MGWLNREGISKELSMRRITNSTTRRSFFAYMAIAFSTTVLFAGGGSVRAADVSRAPAPARADAMLKQIEDLKEPKIDVARQPDEAYRKQHGAEVRKWMEEKADLQGKFVVAYPDDPKAGKMRN